METALKPYGSTHLKQTLSFSYQIASKQNLMKKNSIVTSSFLNVNIVRASFKNKYLLWIWYKPNTCETLLTLRVIRYGFVYFWIVKRNRTRSRNVHILRSSHYRIVNPFDYTSTHVAYVMYSRCQFTPKQTVCKWQFLYSVQNSISCTNERVLYQFLIVFILPFITNTRTIRKLNQPGSFGVWFDLYSRISHIAKFNGLSCCG